MSCKPDNCCPTPKFLSPKPNKAKVTTVVRDVNPNDNGLEVTFTTGDTKVIPVKSTPSDLNFVNVLNASGTKTVATFATKHEEKTND